MSKYKIKKYNSKKSIINLFKFDLWDNNILLKNKIKSKRLYKKLYGKKKKYFSLKYKDHYFLKNLKNHFVIINNKIVNKSGVVKYYLKLFFKLYNLYKKKKNKNIKLKKFLFTKLSKFKKVNYFFKFKKKQIKFKKKKKNLIKLLNLRLNTFLFRYKKLKNYTKIIKIKKFKKFKKFKKVRNLKKYLINRLLKKKKNLIIKVKEYLIYKKNKKKVELPLYFDYVQKKYITVKEYLTYKNLKLNRYNNDFLHTYYSKYLGSPDINLNSYKRKNNFNYNFNYNNNNNLNPLNVNYLKNVAYKYSILNIKKIYRYKKRKIYNKFGKAIVQKQHLKKYFFNISTKKLKNFYKKINKINKHKINKINNNFLYNLEYTIFFFILRSKLIKDHFVLKLFIESGNVLINNLIIFDQFYRLKIGDVITFKNNNLVKLNFFNFKISKIRRPLSHILISYSILKLIFIKKPKLNELKYTFKINSSFLNYLNRNRLN